MVRKSSSLTGRAATAEIEPAAGAPRDVLPKPARAGGDLRGQATAGAKPAATGKLRSSNRGKRSDSKRGDDVRERVLEAALDCFSAFGFEGTSTREIAKRAGVTHSLILYHFQSKDQLWIATIEQAVGVYVRSLKDILEDDPSQPAGPKLHEFIEHFVRFSARYPQIHRILTMESTQASERLTLLVDHYLRDHFNAVRNLIQRGQMEGSVRDGDAVRLYYHIIGAGGTLFTLASEYRMLSGRDVFSEAEIHHTIAFIFEVIFRRPG